VNDKDKVIAFHRWDRGGAQDDTVVVANLANQSYPSYTIGFPRPGPWQVRLNSDWHGYDETFGNHPSYHTVASGGPKDGLPHSGDVGIGPYTVVILSQDRE
jgi:1,4-alpha-glucan branching enzyme